MALANLALRFHLELGGLAGAGYAAYQLAGTGAGSFRWLAAAAAGAAIVVLWALVVAPRTANGLSQPQKDLIGTFLLLLVAAALALAGQLPVAIGFGLIVVANAILLVVFGDAANQIVRATS